MTDFPNITLVLGGVSSGKSAFAEGLVRQAKRPKTYIATAQRDDVEMQRKIARHQRLRGADWQTVEAPLDVVGALADVPQDGIVLMDCLTLWLSNHMFVKADLDTAFDGLIGALSECTAPIVLVSNEVGLGGVSQNNLARAFQMYQGRLNQRVAQVSSLVVMVTAGLPSALKGAIPKDTI